MRKLPGLTTTAVLLALTCTALEAQEGETFNTLEPVYNVVTVQVHPNMTEDYINNLRRTWLIGTEEAMEEGVVDDFWIFASVTPNDGGMNLLIITQHPNLASFDATDAWRAQIARIDERVRQRISETETDEITANVYPQIRTILGEKLMREIEFIGS